MGRCRELGDVGGLAEEFVLLQVDVADFTWAFVPSADLLLTIGEKMLGLTAEGLLKFETDSLPAAPPPSSKSQDSQADEFFLVKIPSSLKEYPPPNQGEMDNAMQCALDKGYDVSLLPPGIVPGNQGKWGIGLWCKKCGVYVGRVKHLPHHQRWFIIDAGLCPHFGREGVSQTEDMSEMWPGESEQTSAEGSSGALGASDIARAMAAAQNMKVKRVETARTNFKMLESQLEEARWGARVKINVTGKMKRLILENGLKDPLGGQQFGDVFGDPSEGEWKSLVLTIRGRHHEFEEEEYWRSESSLDLSRILKLDDAETARSRSPHRTCAPGGW